MRGTEQNCGYYELNFKVNIEIFDGSEWHIIYRMNNGKGVSFKPWYFPWAIGTAAVYNCSSIKELHRFRSHDVLEGLAEGTGSPLPSLTMVPCPPILRLSVLQVIPRQVRDVEARLAEKARSLAN